MSRHGKRYSPSELTIIRNMVGKYRTKKIAEAIGRNPNALRVKLQTMDLDGVKGGRVTPGSLASSVGASQKSVSRIVNHLFGGIERDKFLTDDQIKAVLDFLIRGKYKSNFHPEGRPRGKREGGTKTTPGYFDRLIYLGEE